MPQRKKNQNKQNFRNSKKSTIQHINYTQELRIPTLVPMEMAQAAVSIDLKKSCSRKPASRKSRCVSGKPPACPTIKFKQLVRQIKSMKLMQDRDKSPSSSKSKPKRKKSTKKMTQTQMNTNANSEMNLTAKLERTLKKLNETDYFKDDEDSLIPLVSSSDAFTYAERQNLTFVTPDYDQDINLCEIRAFCKHSESVYKRNIDFFKGNYYDIMARRIQRAWRRYRTHKIVNRYTSEFIMKFQQRSSDLIPQQISPEQNSTSQRQEVVIESDELYSEQMRRKITYISNLEEEEYNENPLTEEEELKSIKMRELEKWKQIINIISQKKTNTNPQNMELLLQELVQRSEQNKQQLQRKQSHESESNLMRQSPQPEDDESLKHEEFNSKKYIEYLDSDMYPLEPNLTQPLSTINKEKQDELLQKLSQPKYKKTKRKAYQAEEEFLNTFNPNQRNLELEILQLNRDINDESRLSYRSLQSISESSVPIQKMFQTKKETGWYDSRQKSKVNKNIQNLLKCSSEKVIKTQVIESEVIIDSLQKQEQLQFVENRDENPKQNPLTEDLQKEFEEDFYGSEYQRQSVHIGSIQPSEEDDFAKLYTEQQLTKKLAELKKLKQNDSDFDDDSLGDIKSKQNSSEDEPILLRTNNQKITEIKRVGLQENEQSDQDETEIAQKAESVSNMVFNSLIFDILKEMAKFPESMLKRFKQYSTKKPKIKRAQPKQKKNGFSTNQAEIKGFLNEITSYLLNEEPHLFKNLERATGPSALEMLRYMHQSSDEEIYLEDQEDDPSVMVMPNWVFDRFWERKQSSLKYEKHGIDESRQQQRIQYLKSLNKIFFRSLFDCLNECLDFERNYGSFGKPFPWKKSPMFSHILSLTEIHKAVERSQKRLLDVSCTYCGIIIEKEQMASICGNEDYLQQVQEDRLSRMLAQDLVEGEQRWIFYDDEETELLVEVGTYIFQQLVQEMASIL